MLAPEDHVKDINPAILEVVVAVRRNKKPSFLRKGKTARRQSAYCSSRLVH